MQALQVATVVLAAGWLLAAAGAARGGQGWRAVAICLALGGAHAVAAAWLPMAPTVVGLWFAYAVGLPDVRWETAARRVLGAAAVGAGATWTLVLAAGGHRLATLPISVAAAVAAVVAAAFAVHRMRTGSAPRRTALQWLA